MYTSTRWGRAGIAGALVLALWACGPGAEEKQKQEMAAKRQTDWAWLQSAKKTLDAKRAELTQVTTGGGSNAALEAEVGKLTEEFGGRLVDYINGAEIVEGQKPTGDALESIRMKSGEDLVLAREYIEKGGEFQRAIDILEQSLAIDPDNADLKRELEQAKAHRYPTPEEWARLKKGMTEKEVRDILGPVNLRNIKDYPDKGVVAWFYKKEAGGAAAVFFDKKKGGELHAYDLKWEAVKAGEKE